jgi:predicted nucleic acid-binding protein
MSASPPKYNVVDSCGWLEYFAGDPNADFFEPPLLHTATLIVPALCLFEVSKRLLLTSGEDAALEALEMMRKARVVQLNEEQLFLAAKASAKYGLSMGDAMIWQTAQNYSANLYTQDAGMKDLPQVQFKTTIKKK